MREKSTVSVEYFKGMPITVYNSVTDESSTDVEYNGEKYKGFYVSYNNHDRRIYGCKTTALVLGQMQKFFILNGNHTKQYNELIPQGFEACLQYYKDNIDQSNKYSDEL